MMMMMMMYETLHDYKIITIMMMYETTLTKQ